MIESRKYRAWYGMSFSVEIRGRWAKIGFFLHPQIGNFFMRYGLSEEEKLEMEFLHEAGHVQMFPFVWGYYIPFLIYNCFIENFLLITVGMLMFWEILAELYVIKKFRGYFHTYKSSLSPVTLLFWIASFSVSLYPFTI